MVIAASAGGLAPLRCIIAALPAPCSISVFVVVHTGDSPSQLPYLLNRPQFPAVFSADSAAIEASHVYVAPPGHHMIVEPGRIRLSRSPKTHYTRPAADPLFESAAASYGNAVVGVVLSVGDSDAAAGMLAIKRHGGIAMVQDPVEPRVPACHPRYSQATIPICVCQSVP
jgi:two-component system chemotaxis response regulator CheB